MSDENDAADLFAPKAKEQSERKKVTQKLPAFLSDAIKSNVKKRCFSPSFSDGIRSQSIGAG